VSIRATLVGDFRVTRGAKSFQPKQRPAVPVGRAEPVARDYRLRRRRRFTPAGTGRGRTKFALVRALIQLVPLCVSELKEQK